jgi:hypothetical protein
MPMPLTVKALSIALFPLRAFKTLQKYFLRGKKLGRFAPSCLANFETCHLPVSLQLRN